MTVDVLPAKPPRRRSLAIAIAATLVLHLGVLGFGALAASREPPVKEPRIAKVLIGHVDPDRGDFVAEGFANARVRAE